MLLGVLSAILAGGCASSDGAAELAIAGGDYSMAFDAAIAAARDEGFIATALDRRAGIIETEPVNAPSVLEPWHGSNASAAQAWENTFQHQRRRVRFEFAPVGESPPALPPVGELTGPDVLGGPAVERDLTTIDEPVLLRAIVIVERSHSPGERRSAWSRRFVTQSRSGPVGDEAALPLNFWEPVARDGAYERRLLARIDAMLASQGAQPRP